jgi:hypothetical protein
MRIRIHRHITDLAGSGLVLLGFLLATMVLSAAPVLLQELGRHPAPSQSGASDRSATDVSGQRAP